MAERSASTEICTYTATQIFVRGHDLCADLVGGISLGDYIYLLIMGQMPTVAQRAVIEAAIVALAEHGFTPSAIAARLTYMGAPESLQGAVAAGLLGVGDQFVGTVELVAPLLVEILDHAEGPDIAAAAIVARYRAAKALIPGFGQPHHKPDDPRSPALFAVAQKFEVAGEQIAALKLLGQQVDAAAGRHFTINAPAATAALFLGIGIPLKLMRGFILISRCIGLVAHLGEEQKMPAGRALWQAGAGAVSFTGDVGE